MRCRYLMIVVMLLGFTVPSIAIDVAVPSDFPGFDLTSNDPDNPSLYYAASSVFTFSPGVKKPYAYVLDADGNLRWFSTDREFTDYFPHHSQGRFLLIRRNEITDRRQLVVFRDDFTVERTVAAINPFHPWMRLDVHEAQLGADGNIWTLWTAPAQVDMSDWIPGGNPDAVVQHNCIQEWDESGDLVWEWYSGNHLDRLPYTGLVPDDLLLDDHIEHLHVNSFQIVDDGAGIVVNSRNMNCSFYIDKATGEVVWILGGDLNEFDLFTNLQLGDGVDLDFTRAHDGRLYPDGRFSIFDNGIQHDLIRSYGREYQLDFDAMTAELIWYFRHPDQFSAMGQGSTRIGDDGRHLMGWGIGGGPLGPTKSATEVTPDNEIMWEIKMYADPAGESDTGVPIYRWYRLDSLPVAAQPYLSEVSTYSPDGSTIELVMNWFGHEDDISGYRVYVGDDENTMVEVGISDDGYWFLEDVDPLDAYYCMAVPVDGAGNAIGPASNVLEIHVASPLLKLTPTQATVPPGGGNVIYNARYVSTSPEEQTLTYSTQAVLPNGQWHGPFFSIDFVMPPESMRTAQNIMVAVPGTAPAGQYELVGNVRDSLGRLIARDSFVFTKQQGGANVSSTSTALQLSATGNLQPFRGAGETAPSIAAEPFVEDPAPLILSAHPNPFNGSTAVSVTLPRVGSLHLDVLNLLGRRVATLHSGELSSGVHQFVLDGSSLASGVYLLRAQLNGAPPVTTRLTLLK